MRKILITGGAGFIGSYCIQALVKQYPDYFIVNLDKLTYAANLSALKEIKVKPNYHFVKGDITDFLLVTKLFQQFNFDGVIHLAAESHVDRSIIDPLLFVKTNVEGTNILLHAAYKHWFQGPSQPQPNFAHHLFLYASTDEVYGALSDNITSFTEASAISPTNPYSASKAAGECLVNAYMKTYGLNSVITRSTNNYGIGQHQEKLIPMVISNALQEIPILLHGNGSSIRDWLHVEDHCRAIDLVFHRGQSGHCYNISANDERTNLEVTWIICQILDDLKPLKKKSYTSFISFIDDRPGQDRRYALDSTKIKEALGWKPSIGFQEGVEELVQHCLHCSLLKLKRPLYGSSFSSNDLLEKCLPTV